MQPHVGCRTCAQRRHRPERRMRLRQYLIVCCTNKDMLDQVHGTPKYAVEQGRLRLPPAWGWRRQVSGAAALLLLLPSTSFCASLQSKTTMQDAAAPDGPSTSPAAATDTHPEPQQASRPAQPPLRPAARGANAPISPPPRCTPSTVLRPLTARAPPVPATHSGLCACALFTPLRPRIWMWR